MQNLMSKEINYSEIQGVLLTVNLKGSIAGPKQHVDIEEISHRVGAQLLTKKIRFTPRGEMSCCRKSHINAIVAQDWMSGKCPEWSNKFIWSKLKKKERLELYINRFDEGFGVSFEII